MNKCENCGARTVLLLTSSVCADGCGKPMDALTTSAQNVERAEAELAAFDHGAQKYDGSFASALPEYSFRKEEWFLQAEWAVETIRKGGWSTIPVIDDPDDLASAGQLRTINGWRLCVTHEHKPQCTRCETWGCSQARCPSNG